jgi:DNA-binding NarL/FixJ family response regulator
MTLSRAVRVLLVDQADLWRSIVRKSLSVPGIEIVGEASTPEAAVRAAILLRPDVVLLDPYVAQMSTRDLIQELTVRASGAKVVLFSDRTDHLEAVRALSSGASGYLTKDVSTAALCRAIRGCGSGDLPMSRRMAALTLGHFVAVQGGAAQPSSADRMDLTGREMEILGKMAAGMTDREIGDDLRISTRTVESHVANVLRKLGVRNRTAATRRFLSLPTTGTAQTDRGGSQKVATGS